jgi:hypothetical protein
VRDASLFARLPAESAFVALTACGTDADPLLRGLLTRPIQWDSLIGLAARERAIAPLLRRLNALPAIGVPPDALDRMLRFALISEFHLMSLHERLGAILALFAQHDIDVVLLKGAGLAYTVYASPTDRPMGDIDLLVRDERADEAWQLALTAGWARRSDVAQERSYEDHQHLPPLEDADGLQLGLELHTALFTQQAPFVLPPSQIWDGARRVRVGSQLALVPSEEDQLLHAALHFAWSHEMTFGAWRTLRDVERLAASDTLQWDTFVDKARLAHGATCCYWTLRLARDLVSAPVPSGVLDALAPRLPEWTCRTLTEYFSAQALPLPGTTTRSVSLSRTLWSLAIRPRAQGHGASRPWLDTEEWVRDAGEMKSAKGTGVQRLLQQGLGLLRLMLDRIAS